MYAAAGLTTRRHPRALPLPRPLHRSPRPRSHPSLRQRRLPHLAPAMAALCSSHLIVCSGIIWHWVSYVVCT